MAKIFIMDNDSDLIKSLTNKIQTNNILSIIGTANNGKEGLEFIRTYNGIIDILLIDLLLPVFDGLKVLAEINKKYRNKIKKIVVTSAMFSSETIAILNKEKVNYTLLKPYSTEACVETLKNVSNKEMILDRSKSNETYINIINNRENNTDESTTFKLNVEREVTNLLHELGIPANLKGYTYLRIAIVETFYNRNYLGQVTKLLYPEIARRCNSTTSRVERAIRHAIEISINRGNIDIIDELFGYTINLNKSRPTNSEFIAMISDSLRTQFQISHLDYIKNR